MYECMYVCVLYKYKQTKFLLDFLIKYQQKQKEDEKKRHLQQKSKENDNKINEDLQKGLVFA